MEARGFDQVTHLETTSEDPEQDGQIVTRFSPLWSNDTNGQAIFANLEGRLE
jgi:hypothetical protein